MRRTRLLLLALLALLPLGGLGGCGGGAGGRGGFSSTLAGPLRLALPVFADGTLKTLVLRNLVDAVAAVRVVSIPGGAFQDVNVPARGELRRAVAAFGVGEGCLVVDTTIGANPGFVEPYLVTERSGPDAEATPGAVLQSVESVIPVHPLTDEVLLFNASAVPVTYTVCSFGATDGVVTPPLLDITLLAVGPNSFSPLDLSFIRNQAGVGHFSVLPPAGGPFFYTLAAHQDADVVLEVDDRVNGTSRLLDVGGTPQAELMLEFGKDTVSGGYEDFDLLVSNASDLDATFTIQSIRDEFGNPIKTTPSTFQMPARQSRLFRTTVVDSLGLQVGETHPFAAHFGDVFLATGLVRFHMSLSIGPGLFVSALEFDPTTGEFAGRVRPTAIRRTASVLVSDAQTSLLTGTENVETLSNPTGSPITVLVRAFTKDLGTEYQLPSFTIPAHGMADFRADALHLKETPGVPTLADVPFLRLLFSSNAPFGVRGRQAGRDVNELLVVVTPHIVRFEE